MCQICNNKVLLIETPSPTPPHLNGVDYINWCRYTPNQIRPVTNDCKDCCTTTYYYFAMVVYKTSSLHIYIQFQNLFIDRDRRPDGCVRRCWQVVKRRENWNPSGRILYTKTCPTHRHTHKKERGEKRSTILRRSRSNSTKIYAPSHCYYYEPTGRRKIIKEEKHAERVEVEENQTKRDTKGIDRAPSQSI